LTDRYTGTGKNRFEVGCANAPARSFLKGRGILDAADASCWDATSRFIPHDPSLFNKEPEVAMTHFGNNGGCSGGQALIEFRRTNKA